MSKKKFIGIALIIAIFIGLAATIVYIFAELKEETDIQQLQNTEITDAKKFKQEYEDLNGKEYSEGNKYRTVSIDEKNPIKYATATDIINKIDSKETFIVYFGYDSCPWCRLVIEELLYSSKQYNIDTIYYVDIKNIRDKYELDTVNNRALRTVEGTSGYYLLLEKLSNVLDDYEPLTYETKDKYKKKKIVEVPIDEKRIYAPNVILVKTGTPLLKVTGIKDTITDPYTNLTEDIKKYSNEEFSKLFSEINPITTTTSSLVCDEHSNC